MYTYVIHTHGYQFTTALCDILDTDKISTIASYKALNPGIIISSSAIYGAPNIRATAIDMKEVLANGC